MRKGIFTLFIFVIIYGCQLKPKQHDICSTVQIALQITYPQNCSLFPPDISAPTFKWKDNTDNTNHWLITLYLPNGDSAKYESQTYSWKPDINTWQQIKTESVNKTTVIKVAGVNKNNPNKVLSAAQVQISITSDEVGDCIFYREVPLPFIDAVKDPSRIRWRYGSIGENNQPPVVLEKLPVCGNCHSFSKSGELLGMDIDYANDKGSYAISQVKQNISLNVNNIISWSDYKKDDNKLTFGLLSQVSPDGNYAISTVKDRSVFVPVDNLEYSQLFFPIEGILVCYSVKNKSFTALSGADDPELVQSNPSWSPDGKYIVFARSTKYHMEGLKDRSSALLSPEECSDFINRNKLFLYDLYRVPFNNGKGGKPEPILGASNNGKSNYFAKYSPNGKWIVFCQASSFMLLQPDSKLFIIPANGGEAKELNCNSARMNSWHSWSSNSKWLVFSSKQNGAYTQLFITHIDDEGNASPAILLENLTSPDMAANIPEFVPKSPEAIAKIKEDFIDKISADRIGLDYKSLLDWEGVQLMKQGKYFEAEKKYVAILEIDSLNLKANYHLGIVYAYQSRFKEAEDQFVKTISYYPNHALSYEMLGMMQLEQGLKHVAILNLKQALRLDPTLERAKSTLEKLKSSSL